MGGGAEGVRLHRLEIKKFTCDDQADREEPEMNCVILTNFAALDTIKKLTSLTKLSVITVRSI